MKYASKLKIYEKEGCGADESEFARPAKKALVAALRKYKIDDNTISLLLSFCKLTVQDYLQDENGRGMRYI